MSLHAQNVTAALANHKAYFGEGLGSTQQVDYRQSEKCDWALIDGAVVHGEYVAYERIGNNHNKKIKRNIFCDAVQISDRLNAHVRIGGDCGPIYNITEITRKGNRYQLHCTKLATVETTRPDYRTPSRR